jgi:hypothetical protein
MQADNARETSDYCSIFTRLAAREDFIACSCRESQVLYLWNVGQFLWDCTALHLRRQSSSYSPPWEPEVSLTCEWLTFLLCISDAAVSVSKPATLTVFFADFLSCEVNMIIVTLHLIFNSHNNLPVRCQKPLSWQTSTRTEWKSYWNADCRLASQDVTLDQQGTRMFIAVY